MNTNLQEGIVYVVQDYNDEEFSLVNASNGEEITIYIAYDENILNKLHENGICSNIFKMAKNDFIYLDLGSNLIFENNILNVYTGPISLCNAAAIKLENMYFSIEEDNNCTFTVVKIEDTKIFLTYSDGSGYFSIYREAYPEFEVGNSLRKENGKYVKI